MKGRPVAVAASMIVIGAVGLVLGAIRLASSGYWPSMGPVAIGVLLVVGGAALLRDTRRAARRTARRHPPEGNAYYASHPWPSADAGSSSHGDRQRDGGHDSSVPDHNNSGGTEPVGGSTGGDSGRGWSGWGWSSGDSGGGWSGGDSGGGWSGGGGDSGGGGGGGS